MSVIFSLNCGKVDRKSDYRAIHNITIQYVLLINSTQMLNLHLLLLIYLCNT